MIAAPIAKPIASAPPTYGVNAVWMRAMGAYVVVLAILGAAILFLNKGRFAYLLDDAYIHLAIARDLVVHGTWGIAPGVYESASSSPLWTLVLALVMLVAGPLAVWAPLALNVVAAGLLLYMLARTQRLLDIGASLPDRLLLVCLPLILLLAPLTLVGMEHLWHAVLVLGTLIALGRLVSGSHDRRVVLLLATLLMVGTLVRMETLFLGAGCAAAFAVAAGDGRLPRVRALMLAGLSFCAAGLPAVALGAFNLIQGQFFFANSVVAKTALSVGGGGLVPSPAGYLAKLGADPVVAALLVAAVGYAVLACTRSGRRLRPGLPLVVAFLVTLVLHLTFAGIGWYDRYQAYLVIAGVYLVLRLAPGLPTGDHHRLVVSAVLVGLLVLATNKAILTLYAPVASSNIYSQHLQLGGFFGEYYNGRGILVHELGAIGYLHDGPIVDLYGLGSHEVLVARREGNFDGAFVRATSARHHVVAAAVYSASFRSVIPPEWVRVGTWSLDRNPGNLGGTSVDFYAPDLGHARELHANLSNFQPSLPADVRVSYDPLTQ
jgi:hypothetical protein